MRNLRLRLPLWVGPRAYFALGALAVLFGCSPGLRPLAAVSIAAAVVLAAAFIADAVRLPRRGDLNIVRILPDHLALRAPIALTYEIENRSPYAVRAGILEAPIRVLRDDGQAAIAFVPPGRRGTISRRVLPVARGLDTLGALHVWYEGSIGLLRRRIVLQASRPIRVYPDLSAVERYGSLRARNRLIEAGLRRMRLRGLGTEFESLRDYAVGDAFRSVDWKASARRGKLMVAQREVERSQDVVALLDCGRLMTARIDDQRKLDYAVTAALSLATIASLASDRAGVVAFAREILVARAPRSTASSIRALSDAVCDLEPRFEESDYAHAFAYVRGHLHRRSLIVLFTDAIDPVAQSLVLAELRSLAKRHVVLCVFMNDAAVADALAAAPERSEDAFRASVALGLQQERAVAVATLGRLGIRAIDVPARSMNVATIDAYLRIKQRGLL